MKKIKKATTKTTAIKKIKEPISSRIAKAVSSAKRISERIVGYIPYDVRFVKAKYTGKTQKPAKITALEKGIIGILLVDDCPSYERIGTILGLDVVNDKAEKAILDSAMNILRGYNAVEGDDSCIALTTHGRTYAEKGERPETYSSIFELYIDLTHPNWLDIKSGIGKNSSKIEEINTPCQELTISLDDIKTYAGKQATNVHFPQDRFLLESANWIEGHEASYKIFICFVQNVANSEDVRAFVYDENIESINEAFSNQINSDEDLKKELLGKCIALECQEDTETTILQTEEVEEAIASIPEEIKSAEKSLIQEEQRITEESPSDIQAQEQEKSIQRDRLRKKALYDSLSFELELHKMFTEDDADEIWLISPWIRQSAFMHDRGPMIETFLQDDSKKVFIAYSEPARVNDDKPMVDELVEPKIQQLEDQYPNFFYVQLPEFHLKNVFEVRGDQKVLFSGSFNVLSFSVSENQTHIRREEMTLAHHTVAKRKYEDFQIEFAQIYAQRIKKQLESLKPEEYANYNTEKLDYFLSIDNAEINQMFSPLQDMIEEQAIRSLKEDTLRRLTNLDQRLVAARNSGGINAKDKKKFSEELSKLCKIISDNFTLKEDPSIQEHLNATTEKVDTLQVKAIFPGRSRNQDKRQQAMTKHDSGENASSDSNIIEKANNIVTRGNPSSKQELWELLVALLYLYTERQLVQGALRNHLKKIVSEMEELYDGLKIEASPRNPDATSITFMIEGDGISFNNLYLGNTRSDYERYAKLHRRRVQWAKRENLESILSQF